MRVCRREEVTSPLHYSTTIILTLWLFLQWDRVSSDLGFPLMDAFVVFLQHHFPQLFILLLQTLQHPLILQLNNDRLRQILYLSPWCLYIPTPRTSALRREGGFIIIRIIVSLSAWLKHTCVWRSSSCSWSTFSLSEDCKQINTELHTSRTAVHHLFVPGTLLMQPSLAWLSTRAQESPVSAKTESRKFISLIAFFSLEESRD